jgi:3-methyl-2-oxobutanoate hydroxymethyltransferase
MMGKRIAATIARIATTISISINENARLIGKIAPVLWTAYCIWSVSHFLLFIYQGTFKVSMSDKVTAPSLKRMRDAGEKIVCITAYDFPSALIADESGVDLILVGDSLGNVIQGHETTIPVDLEDIVYHVRCVRRGCSRALLVADLPFGSYNVSTEQAIESSIKLMKSGADAVKLEGDYSDAIRGIVKAGIPVMGHVGFTPQSIHNFGGARVQGRGDNAEVVLSTAQSIESSGAFGIVLELIPSELAGHITDGLSIPTIGIGAGLRCSGEIQVWHDILGLTNKQHKHTRFFMNARAEMNAAVGQYAKEVKAGSFPSAENSF